MNHTLSSPAQAGVEYDFSFIRKTHGGGRNVADPGRGRTQPLPPGKTHTATFLSTALVSPLACGCQGTSCRELRGLPWAFLLAGKWYITKQDVGHAESFWNYSNAFRSRSFPEAKNKEIIPSGAQRFFSFLKGEWFFIVN